MEQETIESIKSGLADIKDGLTDLTSALKTVQDDNAKLRADLDTLRRARLKLDRSSLSTDVHGGGAALPRGRATFNEPWPKV
jgi:septation ring formation regulator EzrA